MTLQRRHQQGVALISVLLVFAIVTILATQLITRSQSDIERTRWLTTEAQAYQYALGGEALARQILWQQAKELQQAGINRSPIPTLLPVYQPDYGQMAVEIVDPQGHINLNNINSSPEEQKPVLRLLTDILMKPELGHVLADWIDEDSAPRAGGAEDFAYLSLDQPYRTGNRIVASASEMMALAGMPVDEYASIEPYISALPTPTAINVNTAPAEVFGMIDSGISEHQVMNYREQNPGGFHSVEAFLAANVTAGLEIPASLLTVTSSHYGVKILATVNDRKLWLFSRLHFESNNGEIKLQGRTVGEEFTINTLDTTDADQDDKATQHIL